MKAADKQRLELFRQRVRYISENTLVHAHETTAQKDERKTRLLKDYNAFVMYYFPHYASCACASFHTQAARKMSRHRNIIAVFEWARGHAKSTHFTIFIPLWLKARKEMKVMLLVSKSYDAAETLLSDLQAELEGNERYIADYGTQLKEGAWQEGRFATHDDCAFFALGRGQSPRGLRHRQHRPDYIVMDDIDDDEMSRNPDRVQKALDWVNGALYFATDMGRGRFILVGNRISNTSILAEMAEMKNIYHSKVNALTANGEPSWPEKYTREEIENIIATKGYRHTQRELFNNPIVEGAVFSRDWIQFTTAPNLNHYDGLVSYCDPSFKNSATSDYKAIVTVGSRGKNYYIVHCMVRKCSIDEMVRHWYDYHDNLPPTVVCDYYMEANFLQDMIFDAFSEEGVRRGYQLAVRGDKRKKPDKWARIEAISPLFERGLVFIDERIKGSPDTVQLLEQLLAFEKGSRSHDDGPDALEGALWLLGRTTRKQAHTYRYTPRQNRSF